MITYQHLFGLVILNLIILIALILFCKLSNKAERYRDFLLSVCWLVFSWYYQLQISDHLPTSIHRNHPFLEMFVTIAYGFGCWLSIILTFILAAIAINQILYPEASSVQKNERRIPNHSPWPFWIASLLIGLFSAHILEVSLIPGLNKLMDLFTKLIYVDLFHLTPQLPGCYLPAAGIAAGFVYYLCLIFVPVITAFLAPLTDIASPILVIVLLFATAMTKGQEIISPKRSAAPYVLPALGIGCLSGFYYYVSDMTASSDARALAIVGGIVSGFTIACLGFKSYMCENNRFRSLYYWGLIPYCSMAFGFFVEYIICLVGAFILLGAGIQSMHSGRDGNRIELWTENSNPVYYMGHGKITFLEHGETVEAYESALYMDTYLGNNGKKYEINGNSLDSV